MVLGMKLRVRYETLKPCT